MHVIRKKEPGWEVVGSNLVSDKIHLYLLMRFLVREGSLTRICSHLHKSKDRNGTKLSI